MDTEQNDFPDDLRSILDAEVASVAGEYSPRFPANPYDRQTAGFVQAALRKLGHEVSIGEAAAFWQNYVECLQEDWSDDVYTVPGAVLSIVDYCRYKAGKQ